MADKLLRTVVVYLGIALALRLAGKRDLAQLNSFDLVVTLLLANVVQNAIIGPDDSLSGGLVGVVVLLTSTPPWSGSWDATTGPCGPSKAATPLLKDGHYPESALRREGLRKADIEVALRQQNANGPDEVAEATLTPGGAVIVWLKPPRDGRTARHVAPLRRPVEELQPRLSDKPDILLAGGEHRGS